MTAFLLAILAFGCLLAAWLGRRAGNEARDVRLMFGIGCALGVASAAAA